MTVLQNCDTVNKIQSKILQNQTRLSADLSSVTALAFVFAMRVETGRKSGLSGTRLGELAMLACSSLTSVATTTHPNT